MKKDRAEFQKEAKNLIEVNARALVDNPDGVEVRINQGENTTVFYLACDKIDLGKLIGKQGKTAQAMRTILINMASKYNFRAILEIEE